MKNKLKIFVGEYESYKPEVEATFLKQLNRDRFEVVARDAGKIPTGFDIYLLHVSHFDIEQVKDLQRSSPGSVIMLRTQTSDLIAYPNSDNGKRLIVNGFYTPSMRARGFEQDLAKVCLQELNKPINAR